MPMPATSIATDAPKSGPTRTAKAALLAGLLAAMLASGAAANELATPEAAIAAYIDGVVAHDLDAILAATSVEPMSENFDLEAYVDRLRVLNVSVPAPATDPMYVAINRASFTAKIAEQVQFLTYGLLSATGVDKGRSLQMDRAGASAFVNELDLSRLDGLNMLQIFEFEYPADRKDRYLASIAAQALTFGADEKVERGAVLEFEGARYIVGFTLLRYGDTWGVSSQSSDVMGTSSLGSPEQITP
jgi:hypothetical protein